MVRSGEDATWAELDFFVRAYELAYLRDERANLTDFVPAAHHPLYLAVLRELVRVDLEYCWQRGCPKSLERYLEDYPDLNRDLDSLQEIIFEEFRLRWQAGQNPSPEEYVRRYGQWIAGRLERWWASGTSSQAVERRSTSLRQDTPPIAEEPP
jgi:eukaryotic-like serine/threonine-protein kinase